MVHLSLQSISKHLTPAVIDKAFKLKTKSEDNVLKVEVTRAAAAGDGLIGAVHRIHVIGKDHKTSFIAKSLVKDALLRKSLRQTENLSSREALFFLKVLPALVDVQKSLGAKEMIQNNVPVCYGCHIDGFDDYILMEDLAQSNCTPVSESPTKYEMNMNLKALAHLHAVSLAWKLKRPKDFAKLTTVLPDNYYKEENRSWYAKYLQSAIKVDKDVMADIEDPKTSVYYKKFEELVTKDVYSQLVDLVSTRGDHFTLCHGDAWCSNFLCSSDRAVAVDFQILRCASPVTDVAYFITMCSNVCRDKESFLKAVRFYYDSFVYYLEDMGLRADKILSWVDFNDELKRFGKFGILAALTSIPLTCSERCDVLESFERKYTGVDEIPLEVLWPLTPIEEFDQKMRLVNAVRIAVDVGLI